VPPALPPESSPAATTFRVGEIGAANAGEMRALFTSVFGKPMSEAFWNWKYRDGHSHCMGVWDGDTLVAHYGGVGTDVVYDGKTVNVVQIADVMVMPAARYAVRKHSPFFLATTRFIERYVGYGQTYLMGFGFPSDRHLHLAQRLGLYAPVGGMSELSLERNDRRPSDWLLQTYALTTDSFSRHAAAIDRLWQSMQASLPTAIVVRKNAERIRNRYLLHPENHYHCLLWRHRLTGKPFALAVVKQEPARMLLMDVVAAAADFPRVLRLVAHAMTLGKNLPVVFWLSSAWIERLQLATLAVQPLPITTPANIYSKGPTPDELQDRWCLTAGDTDYL
jgi:hypothetical protein